jgi:hypothetical protein
MKAEFIEKVVQLCGVGGVAYFVGMKLQGSDSSGNSLPRLF